MKNDLLKTLSYIVPEIFTDQYLDISKLRELFGDELIHDSNHRRYGLGWYREFVEPDVEDMSLNLREDLSKDFRRTKNIFIKGENLQVLHLLRKSYREQVKMIYIDPPYNTGKDDFIYRDRFADSRRDYAQREGGLDENGHMIQANVRGSGASGANHSNWLNMMYPRLRVARELLREDGVIFISIDDNELAQLRLICDEIFYEENFLAIFPWRKRVPKSNVLSGVSRDIEYVVTYTKSKKFRASIKKPKERKYYKSRDYPDRPWRVAALTKQSTASERPNSFFSIEDPKNGKLYPPNPDLVWTVSKNTIDKYIKEKKIVFPDDYPGVLSISTPMMRHFKDDDMRREKEFFGRQVVSTKLPQSNDDLYDEEGNPIESKSKHPQQLIGMTGDGTKEIAKLFGYRAFDFPKPVSLIKFFVDICFDKEALILDFFGGSGTTAQAVMQMNAEDKGKRRFIIVQTGDELTAEKSEAYKRGLKDISDICVSRIKLAGEKLRTFDPVDKGFKFFELGESNLKQWPVDLKDPQLLVQKIKEAKDPVKEGTDNLVLLYELILRSGIRLDVPIRDDQNGTFWIWIDGDRFGGGRLRIFILALDGPSSVTEAVDLVFMDLLDGHVLESFTVLDRLFDDSEKENLFLRLHSEGILLLSIGGDSRWFR